MTIYFYIGGIFQIPVMAGSHCFTLSMVEPAWFLPRWPSRSCFRTCDRVRIIPLGGPGRDFSELERLGTAADGGSVKVGEIQARKYI